MKVPKELPRLVKATTKSILVTLLRKKSLKVVILPRSSKSSTLGFLTIASTIPANQPAASNGFKEVMGAARNAVRIERGCAAVIRAPRAAKEPFQISHCKI